jgi:hypothetical protein
VAETAKILPIPDSVKRLNVNLPASRLDDLQRLAKKKGTSMTDLVRWALTLVEKVIEEVTKGNKIVVMDQKGRVTKEIVIPL